MIDIKHIRSLIGYKPLCFLGEYLLLSKKNGLYRTNDEGKNIESLCYMEATIKQKMIFSNRLLLRIFRLGFHCAIQIDSDQILFVYDKVLYLFNLQTGEIQEDHKLTRGSRPLMLSSVKGIPGFDDLVCYGEYWHNKDKDTTNIWGRHKDTTWSILYAFPKGTIEHVHAIIPDPFRNVVWILTGDVGSSPGFWVAKDNFKKVEPVVIGRQEFRGCRAFPTKEGLIYGTDSQFETNSIRILKEGNNTWYTEFLHPLNGSCIYACEVQDKFVFSTSVEPGALSGNIVRDILDRKPGDGIKDNYCEMVCGNLDIGFKTIEKWSKDKWPLRLCQFGTILFPTGHNLSNILYAYGIAVKDHDGVTELYSIR